MEKENTHISIEDWLHKHIKKLRLKYATATDLKKKISIGSRLRAMNDFLNLVHQKESLQATHPQPTDEAIALIADKELDEIYNEFSHDYDMNIAKACFINGFKSALNNKSVGLDEKDKEFFDEMTKEEIWRKWQSDKKMLRMYMYAMAHYGVTQFSDVKAVAELEIQNRNPPQSK